MKLQQSELRHWSMFTPGHRSRIRFLRFFSKSKKRDFLLFLKCRQKNVKKRRKPYPNPSFMYTNQITGIRRLQNWVLSEM